MPASGQKTEPALPEQPVLALLRLVTVKHRSECCMAACHCLTDDEP